MWERSFTFRWVRPNGLYGIENERGFVSADESGFLYGSAMIFLFVLAVGAFVTVTMKTGDPDGHRAARAALPAQRLAAARS